MPLIVKAFRSALGMMFAILALSTIASAQGGADQGQQSVNIKNFGRMDERFYRGAQPREEDFKGLAALGIKTIIDLRADPVKYEKAMVESLGMKYINIPMVGKKYPTDEAIQSFLKVINDPATGRFYVHCAGGRHRTGAMGAVYRYTKYGWSYEQVYAEMKKFDFYTSWGHSAFKDFVQDYYERMQASQASKASVNMAQAERTITEAPAAAVQTTGSIKTTDSLASPR
jgi:protein tyrosine/serine phosphatase